MGNLLDLFVFKYNRTDFHELNLDWLISDVKTLAETLQNFVNLNTIKYADPIQWNITKQYETNTVVIDGNTGTAYISTKPVPSGVALTNTDYWTVIFTLDILSANQNITFRNDGANVIATFESNVGDWLMWNSQLYKVIRAITVNEAYVNGYNLERYSVELFIREYITALNNLIGALSDLTTSDTSSIVDAINSIITERGALPDLTTSDTSSIVDAINSIITERGALSDLDTSDKTSIVNAINEVFNKPTLIATPEDFGAVGDGVTDDSAAFNSALNNVAILYIPKNHSYYIGSSVTVPYGKSIMGAGSIIVNATLTDGIVLDGNNTINGISFSDLNKSTYDDAATHLISFSNTKNISVVNCKFNDIHMGYCVYAYASEQFEVNYNYIDGYSYGGICALLSCQHFTMNNNIVLNGKWTTNTNRYPIAVSGFYDINNGPARFIECNYNYIEDTTPFWEGIDSHGCTDAEFIGNTIKNVAYGIALGQPTNAGNLIANNERLVIKDNYIEVTTAATGYMYGIQITSDVTCISKEIEIANNTIIGNGTPTSLSDSTCGISLSTRANGRGYKNIDIHNNEITGNFAGLGFSTLAANILSNVHIHHNKFTGDHTASHEAIRFNNLLSNDYDNFEFDHNIISYTAGYDIIGTTSYTGSRLIDYHDNIDNGVYSRDNFITTPKASLPSATSSKGMPGQKIRNTGTGNGLEWVCKNTGTWQLVSGA